MNFFSLIDLSTLFRIRLKEWTLFLRLKDLNIFLNMTQRIEQRIDFLQWLNFFWKILTQRIELFFFLNITQRIEPFYDSKNWTIEKKRPKEIEHSLFNLTLRIEPLFNLTQKNWTLFVWFMTRKNWTFFVWFMTRRIEHFSEFDSKNRTFFFTWLKHFFKIWHRIGLILSIWLKELNFFQYDSKNSMFEKKGWRKELNLFFLNMTQRIEPFLHDSKNWIFFRTFWIKDLNFCQYDSKELNFDNDSKNSMCEKCDSKNWTFYD